MRKETIELEKLRQRIAAFDWEAIDLASKLGGERPSEKEKKLVEQSIAPLNEEIKKLLVDLHELIVNSPKEAVVEWGNWHKGVLEEIIKNEPAGTANTRLGMAKFVLEGWKKLLKGEQEYVSINKYFLKDYVAKAEETFPQDMVALRKEIEMKAKETKKKSSWKFWE